MREVSLSESDAEVLREMVSWWRTQRRKSTYDPRAADHEEHPAPEVYIALTPAGGISGMSHGALTGTGSTALADDSIYSAECYLYVLKPTSTSIAALSCIDGMTHEVYNLSTLAIPGGELVLVERDKAGSWIVVNVSDLVHQLPKSYRYHCINGVLEEWKVVPGGEVFVREVMCCDPSCADTPGPGTGTPYIGTGTLHSDECCYYYPPKICLLIANLSATDADIRGRSITLNWMDSLPANRVGNYTDHSGYYGTATFNSHVFEWWFVRRGSFCTFSWDAEKDDSGSFAVGTNTSEATLFLGPTLDRRCSWTCSPFTMTLKDYSNVVFATVVSGECSSIVGSTYGNGIATACCPLTNTAYLLTASISSGVGFLDYLPGTLTLAYMDTGPMASVTPGWYANLGAFCTVTSFLRLICDGTLSGWKLAIVDDSGNVLVSEASFAMGALTCSPFEAHFVADAGTTNTCQPGQTGQASIVITE